jgi:hypothetical protein
MNKIAARFRAMSLKKQAALGLFGLWLVLTIAYHVPPLSGDGSKAEAAQAKPAPKVVRWGGLTKAEAIALSYKDEFYADAHIAVPVLFTTRHEFDRALAGGLMQKPSAKRARCKGARLWYVTFASSTWPTAWYESKKRGDNAFVCEDIGASDSMTVWHRGGS